MTLNVRREIFESSSSSPFPGLDILAILYLLKSLLYLKLLCYQQHLSSAEIGLVVACFVFLPALGILAFAACKSPILAILLALSLFPAPEEEKLLIFR